MPLPDPRPSEKIAKLFPQGAPARDTSKGQEAAAPAPASTVAQAQGTATPAAAPAPVPLPEARPASAPSRDTPQHRHRGSR
jgi:peptidoglycan lytic transglycosylase A